VRRAQPTEANRAAAAALEGAGFVLLKKFDRRRAADRWRLLDVLRVASADATLRLPCGSAGFPEQPAREHPPAATRARCCRAATIDA
jgi:hypothetical protein